MFPQKNYYIITYGCQMNEHDTEVLSGMLEALGYEPADNYQEADVLVLNTCAVRKKAEEKVRALLGRLVEWKKHSSARVLAVGGCVPGQENYPQQLRQRFHNIDIIFGTNSLPRFPQMLRAVINGEGTQIDTGEDAPDREGVPVARKSGFRAWVPVIYGCNNFCSYCVVPYVRGRERSRPRENIISEVTELGRAGYIEITLLGQNVNAYGKDIYEQGRFAELLQELAAINDLKRIRFLTSHPRDFSPDIIEAVAAAGNICNHFHLPLQAGSDRILEKMNRGYDREKYLKLVSAVRQLLPAAAITTDLIAGFPGETEADFNDTLNMVETIRFDAAYTFNYSVRKGTPAANMTEMVSNEEKKDRITRLINTQKEIGLAINQALTGTVQEILVEGQSKTDADMLTGRTGTNKLVHFKGDSALIGKLVNLKITEARTWHLRGEKV